MKVSAKGAVTFSLLSDDSDLRNLIQSLPSQVGSDILRALLRDGIEYQKSLEGKDDMSNLSMLCGVRRMDSNSVIQPFFDEECEVSPTPIKLKQEVFVETKLDKLEDTKAPFEMPSADSLFDSLIVSEEF